MVGALPPPVHGMAAVNAAVRERLMEAGANPIVIDVSPRSLERSLSVRLRRLPRVVRGLARLIATRRLGAGTLYISVSGGFGQVYEVLFLMAARLRQMCLYLHHHSFAYLDRPTYLTRALTFVAGPAAVHITLSPGMAARLQANYPTVRTLVPISNAVFFTGSGSPAGLPRSCLKTIGFISNISAGKGVFEFLHLVAACEAEGLHLKAKLAGPFQDAETERQVLRGLEEVHSLEYVGPQYGDDKESFLDSIDALIFPTRYANEAEPLTIHEATSHGLPVIAYGRGSIPEIIGSDCGLVIDPAEAFVPGALAQIRTWLGTPASFEASSRAAARHFSQTYVANTQRWGDLLDEMVHGPTDMPRHIGAP